VYKSGAPWNNVFGLVGLNCKGLGVKINVNPASPTIVTGFEWNLHFEYKTSAVQSRGIIDFTRPDQLCFGVTFTKLTMENVVGLMKSVIPTLRLPEGWNFQLGEKLDIVFSSPTATGSTMGFECVPGARAHLTKIPLLVMTFSAEMQVTFVPPALEVKELKADVNAEMIGRVTKTIIDVIAGACVFVCFVLK
jgi:hypothetical protein